MGKSAPAAPDPTTTANAQSAANEATARVQSRLNNPNTYGPGGAVEHVWGPDDTQSVYTYLSPGQQRIYDNQTQLSGDTSQAALDATGRMTALLNSPLNTSGLTPWNTNPTAAPSLVSSVSGAGQGIQTSIPGAGQGITTSLAGAGQGIATNFDGGQATERLSTDDYGAQRDQVTDAIMSRAQPQYDRDRANMEARLAAQGFTPGTTAYQNAADEIDRNQTDARMQAILAGGQEQSRLFGMDAQRVQVNNAAAQQQTAATNTALTDQNAAQQQAFTQGAQAAQFGNEAQQQGFSQAAQNAAFGNQAQDQGFNQGVQAASFQNAAAAQGLNENIAVAQNQNQLRQQQLAEQLQLRAQPINEVSALFGLGNGVQVPQQAQVSPAQVAAPDYQGLVENNYKQQVAATSANNSATASGIGAVASVAAIAI